MAGGDGQCRQWPIGGACWKFNLECHSFGGGPVACHHHHANLHLSTPTSHDPPRGCVTAPISNGLLSSFTVAQIRLSNFQMCWGFHFAYFYSWERLPCCLPWMDVEMSSWFVAFLCLVMDALRIVEPPRGTIRWTHWEGTVLWACFPLEHMS